MLYPLLHRYVGSRAATGLIILLRAILIVLIIVLSNSQFSSFTYLRM